MSAAVGGSSKKIGIVPLIGVALIGGVIGTAWDLLHVCFGATVYSIGAHREPLWVPVQFALVYVVGVVAISKLGRPVASHDAVSGLARETIWVTVIYTTTAIGHELEWLVAALLVLAIVARRRSIARVVRANRIPAAGLVVLGPSVESILIASGVFRYSNATLGNVPVWLPLLYANAIPFAVRLSESTLAMSRRAVRTGS